MNADVLDGSGLTQHMRPLEMSEGDLRLAACIGIAGWIAVSLGQDSNWDLQNYHYYTAWAWWHDHRAYTTDIAAAMSVV